MSTAAVYWYMILDVTNVVEIKLLYITDIRRAVHRGYILKAAGRQVIAPPLEGRSFSKLYKLQLQYLYYQLSGGQTPPEDYHELAQGCFELAKKFQTDTESLDDLIAKVAELWTSLAINDSGSVPPPSSTEGGRIPAPQAERPKAKGVTGQVWEIADRLYQAAGNSMPDRKLVMEECAATGINSATAATQFAKWKKTITGI
jgi:hypothetical protein